VFQQEEEQARQVRDKPTNAAFLIGTSIKSKAVWLYKPVLFLIGNQERSTKRAKEQVVPLPKIREQRSDLRLFREPVFQQEEEQARQVREEQIRKMPSQKILLISLATLVCLDIIIAIFAFSGSYIMFIPLTALLLATAYCISYMIRIRKE